MNNIEKLELFPKEIYAIEQFITYDYYYETVKIWEELIQYAENLLDRYSRNLASDHRAQHSSEQPDYVWGTIVLPNFKATLHHLLDGLEDLKAGFLPILRRMSSIRNDVIAQGRDYPYDWMDEVEKGAVEKYKAKENIVSIRANNIYVTSDYNMQWGYKNLTKYRELDIGIKYPEYLPHYKLNTKIKMNSGDAIPITGIYRSIELYSACKFFIKEKKLSAEHENDWKLAPKVKSFKNNPDLWTTPDTMENSRRIPTTWILVEKITENNNDVNEISNYIKTSQKGGEKALKTGYWKTPAQPHQRQYFKQGDILPSLSALDWGEVYWYFEGEE